MTLSSWIIDIALVLIVFRQLREVRLTFRSILLPIALMGWAAITYLHGLPTAGNDLVLAGVLTAVGVLFGIASGFATRVRYRAGNVYVKTTAIAAALWVISMGLRMTFAVWSSYSSGAAHVARFSAAHDITSAQAWVTALLLMAFGEVIFRLGIIIVRGQILSARHSESAAPAPAGLSAAAGIEHR